MPIFSETAAAVLGGRQVRAVPLVRLDFTSETVRLWTGFGPLTTGGNTYEGIGRLGTVSDLDLSPGLGNEPATLTLSGVDATMVAKVKTQSSEVAGRRAIIYVQMFDATNNSWAVLDSPYPVFVGVMESMKLTFTPTEGRIDLTVEHILVTKHRPPYGNFSHWDQQGRYPGDRGLERMAHNVNNMVPWP